MSRRLKGAAALSSIGIPTVADRTAARIAPDRSTGATEAKDVSPQIGRAERHRTGCEDLAG